MADAYRLRRPARVGLRLVARFPAPLDRLRRPPVRADQSADRGGQPARAGTATHGEAMPR